METSGEKSVFSISANTNFFIYFFSSSHWHCFEHLLYMCCFFIAEMALTMTCSFLHAPKIFFQCVQNMFLFFISHFYMDVYQQMFLIFRMILFFKLKICNMYIFCMIEFLHVTDLTHSECNMALFFFIGHVYCFSCHKFWCFRFFINIFKNESQIF